MTTHRTCSNTATFIAVSWRVRYAAAPDAAVDVEVVADALLSRTQAAAVLTVRLLECDALVEVYIGARLLASYGLSREVPEAHPILGSLFRRVIPLPAGLVDGHTHVLTVLVKRAVQERTTMAIIESAFYARPASNRRLSARSLLAPEPADAAAVTRSL